MTFTFGLSNFWATINLLELTSENSTFPTGPLSHQEFSFIISIGNIGSLLGNFIILPISQTIGVKYSIHLLGVPMIVSIQKTINFLNFSINFMTFILDMYFTHNFRNKCILFVHRSCAKWDYWRCFSYCSTSANHRYIIR